MSRAFIIKYFGIMNWALYFSNSCALKFDNVLSQQNHNLFIVYFEL